MRSLTAQTEGDFEKGADATSVTRLAQRPDDAPTCMPLDRWVKRMERTGTVRPPRAWRRFEG
jgi:hypothetical protein